MSQTVQEIGPERLPDRETEPQRQEGLLARLRTLLQLLSGGGGLRSQTFWVVFGDGVTLVALTATAMALARIIAPADMATFKQVTYLGMMVVAFTEFGLSAAIYRFYRVLDPERRQDLLWVLLIVSGALGLLGSVALFFLSGTLASAYSNADLDLALAIGAAYPLAALPFMLVRPLLISRGFSLKATFLETFFALATALALIIPLWAGWTLAQALALWMILNLGRLPVMLWYVAPELRGSAPRLRHGLVRDVWDYTWPIQVGRLPAAGMVYLDKVITSVFLSTPSFAAYALGARELPYLNKIPFSMSSVLLPRMVEAFAEKDTNRVCAYWRKACVSTAVVSYPFAAFCVWNARPIMRMLFTASYDQGAVPFAMCAAITFVRVVEYASLAKALGNTKVILRITVLSAVTSIPLAGVLTYLWGIWGISAFLLLSQSIIAVYYLAHYSKLLQRSVTCFFPFPPLLALAIIAFGSVAIADLSTGWAFDRLAWSGTLGLAIRLLCMLTLAGGLYAVALLASRRTFLAPFGTIRIPGITK